MINFMFVHTRNSWRVGKIGRVQIAKQKLIQCQKEIQCQIEKSKTEKARGSNNKLVRFKGILGDFVWFSVPSCNTSAH